ncbi:hypothetical protein LTR94_032987, partial [Friedmanniomyces endolithicus]
MIQEITAAGVYNQIGQAFVVGPVVARFGERDAATLGILVAVAVYVGYAHGGEGRNAGYAAPGAGDHDWEARLLAARNFGVDGQGGFIEAQAARRWRSGLPDETRLDLTAGAPLSPGWMLLGQAYAGAADDGGA